MSENSGVYILANHSGFRVRWGCYLEHKTARNISLFMEAPNFTDYEGAYRYAVEVARANNPEYGILLIENRKRSSCQ